MLWRLVSDYDPLYRVCIFADVNALHNTGTCGFRVVAHGSSVVLLLRSECMFHLKDLRRSNVSSSPYLSSRLLDTHDLSEHILAPGDFLTLGSFLKGDVVSLLPTHTDCPAHDHDEHFQVIKELGKGSYAVVYLVHHVFFSPSSQSFDDAQILGHMDSDGLLATPPDITYGRKFAIKCLSKANLDKDGLAIQMAEVTIHQSLPLHPNIVTLHKTLQTSSYLLLVMEYVPGEDLFYFLEQARDHYSSTPSFSPMLSSPPEGPSELQQQTPPTPSLLSSLHPSHLLSRTRLRLVASMFAQMCDAVAACHAVGVFHRDIKPENFIVTDGQYLDDGTDWIPGGNNKCRVVVKLTDFGLSTREEECSDVNCGSAPYMSYECRNDIAPTYRPREADVWSLGIVLINMLYHINPWTDTAPGACPSFTAFRQDPIGFFMKLFMGMTHGFAEVLAMRVFCIDDEQTRVNGRVRQKRMTAAELGLWVRSNLVDLLADDAVSSSSVNGGASTTRAVVKGGHRLSLQMRTSHRPSSRAASPFGRGSTMTSPRILAMPLSRAPSLAPALEKEERQDAEGRFRVQVVEEQEETQDQEQEQEQMQREEEIDTAVAPSPSRTSTTKRRKRGLRNKGKVTTTAGPIKNQQQDQQQQEEALKTLADASQSLAREISNVSKTPSVHRLQLQHPSTSSLLTPVNGDGRPMASAPTLDSIYTGNTEDTVRSADGESSTTLLTISTTVPSSIMSVATNTTTGSKPASISLSSANASDSTRTTSKGSSLRTAMTIASGTSTSSGNSRSSRPYEPVSMYGLPSALLSKPISEGGTRAPSRLSSSTSTAPSVATGSGSGTQQQQPKAVVKKSSKWTLRFGKNNNSSGPANNVTSATPSSASVTPAAASASILNQGKAPTLPSRPIPIPTIAPGHSIAFVAPSRRHTLVPAPPTQSTMSPTASNVTDVIMGLDPAPSQLPIYQNESLVGGSLGDGKGGSPTSWSRGRHGTGDSMVLPNGAGGGSSPSKLKSPSRSPGPTAPTRTGGFGSSASSSSASLVSSWVDQGQGRSQQDGWDKWTSDRMGTGSRGIGHNNGREPRSAIIPYGAMGFGAGGGRHGSGGAAGGPFASIASSAMGVGLGSGGSWRAGTSPMNANANASTSPSGSGGASLHGSVSASGNTSPGGSTSAFTRYSNSSLRSVSTTATSVSSGSGTANWRNGGRGGAAVAMAAAAAAFSDADDGLGATGKSAVGGKRNPYMGGNLPKSVKIIDGIPWALNELPRGQHPNADFGAPTRKARSRNKKGNNNNNNINNANGATPSTTDSTPVTTAGSKELNDNNMTNKLDTIIERPLGVGPTSDSPNGEDDITSAITTATGGGDAPGTWKDASTSTTDLVAAGTADEGTGGGRIKKVHKGQINTLAKMLSALRR